MLRWDAAHSEFVATEWMAGMSKRLPEGVRVMLIRSNDSPTLETLGDADFLPSGQGFSGKIQLENRLKDTAWIEVMPVTGQVSIVIPR